MVVRISINAANNVGVMAQTLSLPHRWPIHYITGKEWVNTALYEPSRLLASWRNYEDEEFVSIIFTAVADRHRFAQNSETLKEARVVVFGQGTRMLKAMAVAWICVKNRYETAAQGRKRLCEILTQLNISPDNEEVSILLQLKSSFDLAVKKVLETKHDPNSAATLVNYQRFLDDEIKNQKEHHQYDYTCTYQSGMLYPSVAKWIRDIVANWVYSDYSIPTLRHIKEVYIIEGQSDLWRKRIASMLETFYDGAAHRVNAAHFLEAIEKRRKLDRDGLPSPVREEACILLYAIRLHLESQRMPSILIIENLDRKETVDLLKNWHPNKIQIMFANSYVDPQIKVRKGHLNVYYQGVEAQGVEANNARARPADFVVECNEMYDYIGDDFNNSFRKARVWEQAFRSRSLRPRHAFRRGADFVPLYI